MHFQLIFLMNHRLLNYQDDFLVFYSTFLKGFFCFVSKNILIIKFRKNKIRHFCGRKSCFCSFLRRVTIFLYSNVLIKQIVILIGTLKFTLKLKGIYCSMMCRSLKMIFFLKFKKCRVLFFPQL